MRHIRIIVLSMLIAVSFNCNDPAKNNNIILNTQSITVIQGKKSPLSEFQKKSWHFKDIHIDTLPGISLDKAYSKLLQKRQADTIIMAVLDNPIQIKNIDLADNIWINQMEIIGNGKDDDDNGYIDDINGWNFLGYKNGSSNEFVNYEYTRIIKKFGKQFEGKSKKEIDSINLNSFELYEKALKTHVERMVFAESELKNAINVYDYNITLKEAINELLPSGNHTISALDSLFKAYKGIEPTEMYLDDMIFFKTYGITDSTILEDKIRAEERVNKLLNINYDDRQLIGDEENNLEDIGYGNNVVNHNVKRMNHGTIVASIIAANRNNGIGVNGISNHIKIMPLCISGFGDENDKDMALAIRYAADNGAKIINISSIKYFSLHEDWVKEAIKYAEQKDVLIVHGAGNDRRDVDKISYYPNDLAKNNTEEIVNNFINVGSSGYELNKGLKAPHSAYGSLNVDLFAPGEDILAIDPSDEDEAFVSGTSYATAIVSGVAGLIRSYYPNLSAKEIKYILMNTGVEYNIIIDTNPDSEENKEMPFNELSKSGRIVNAYNALQLAEQMSYELIE